MISRRVVHRLAGIAVAAVLALLLFCAWEIYKPGLSGDFLFDDFANLPALGATGPIDNASALFRYLTSGGNDPIGRPLTLATFLIDARNWPASPYSFKQTNLFLHLLNGALLFIVLWRLGEHLRLSRRQAQAAALFGAGCWLLHPLFVSTTLYIVQREAMLPATFVLLGSLGWMAARDTFARGHTNRGMIGLVLAAWGCTALAALSKANGALLPLLLLVIEWVILSPAQPLPPSSARKYRIVVAVSLIFPSVLLLAYLFLQIPGSIQTALHSRDWTVAQRLLSEPRALVAYLGLLWSPRVHSTGLFTDAFPASTSLLHPITTLPCLVLALALLAFGFLWRKRHPLVAVALLFYFSGQLLESTWIPLELYYEHRNYLPSMLMFWPVGVGLTRFRIPRWAVILAALLILCALGTLTYLRVSIWSDGYRQALTWAAFNPDSARAQANAAQYDLAHDRPHLAAARLVDALHEHPEDLQILLNLIGAECDLGTLRPETLTGTRQALTNAKQSTDLVFKWFDQAIDIAKSHRCRGFNVSALQTLIDAGQHNPYWKGIRGRQQDLAHLQGTLDLASGAARQALREYDRALSISPTPDAALEQAASLGRQGYPELGLMHLDYWASLPPPSRPDLGMPMIHAWVLKRQHYWDHELSHLRATLAADASEKARHGAIAQSTD